METVEIDFAHSVGDFVMTAWDRQTLKRDANPRDKDIWQVIERTYNEHCCGVRVQYVCRCQSSVFVPREKTCLFDPCELVAIPEASATSSESTGDK